MTTATLPTEFDYATLGDNAAFAKTKEKTIHGLMNREVEPRLKIGDHLIETKERLEHGQFEAWAQAVFGWSLSWMLRTMQMSARFKSVNLTDLDIGTSVRYVLAAPSTPDEAFNEVIERAQSGEKITVALAKEIIARHREQPDPLQWTLMSGNYYLRQSVARIQEQWPQANIEVLGHQLKQIGDEIIEHGGLLE